MKENKGLCICNIDFILTDYFHQMPRVAPLHRTEAHKANLHSVVLSNHRKMIATTNFVNPDFKYKFTQHRLFCVTRCHSFIECSDLLCEVLLGLSKIYQIVLIVLIVTIDAMLPDTAAMFLFSNDNSTVHEVIQHKEEFRSWLIGNTVQQGMFVLTRMHCHLWKPK